MGSGSAAKLSGGAFEVTVAGAQNILRVLELFTPERPRWSPEEVSSDLQVSVSTAYRYLKLLGDFGFVAAATAGSYTLGPAIIRLDRQMQISDPLLIAAKPVMSEIIGFAAEGSAILLCRVFNDTVLCLHQVLGTGPQPAVSYERGRPMPLFRGATSKVILANLGARNLRRLYQNHDREIARSDLGGKWVSFNASMAVIRRTGHVVSHEEVDRGRIGIAAPIFDSNRRILGSLSFVLLKRKHEDRLVTRLISITKAGALEIEAAMTMDLNTASSTPGRKRAAR